MKVLGITLAIIELFIFFIPAFLLKKYFKTLHSMNNIEYFWVCFTILTGIWEFFFVLNYDKAKSNSILLLENKTHVWTNKYDITYVFPWKFSEVFYSEYGAYADRLYMAPLGIWSRIIESTHALFCGLFALLSIYSFKKEKTRLTNKYILLVAIAMGSQLMNSLLYMGEYFIQTTTKTSVNYNTKKFPTGILLLKRPFMWVNVLWTVMPAYIICYHLFA